MLLQATTARVCALALAAVLFAATSVLAACTPGQTISTAAAGVFNNPTTWAGGVVPDQGCDVRVLHVLQIDTPTPEIGALSMGTAAEVTITGSGFLKARSLALPLNGAPKFAVLTGFLEFLQPAPSNGNVPSGMTLLILNEAPITLAMGVEVGGTLTLDGGQAVKLSQGTIAGSLTFTGGAPPPIFGNGLVIAGTAIVSGPSSPIFQFSGPAVNETITIQGTASRTVNYQNYQNWAGTIIMSAGQPAAGAVSWLTTRSAAIPELTAALVIVNKCLLDGNYNGGITVSPGGLIDDASTITLPLSNAVLTIFGGNTVVPLGTDVSGTSLLILNNVIINAGSSLTSTGAVRLCGVTVPTGFSFASLTTAKIDDNCVVTYTLGAGFTQGAGVLDKLTGGTNATIAIVGTDCNTQGATVAVVPPVLNSVTPTITVSNAALSLGGTGYRGVINIVSTSTSTTNCAVTFATGAATHATDRLLLRGLGVEPPAPHLAQYKSQTTLTVPSGGSLQLGAAVEVSGGADFRGLTVAPTSGQIWLGSGFVSRKACGNADGAVVHGPLAGAKTRFERTATENTLASITDWAGELFFDSNLNEDLVQVTGSVVLLTNSAKISCDTGNVMFGTLQFVDTWVAGGCSVTVSTSLTSSSPTTATNIANALTLDGSDTILQSNVCQSNCTFSSLTLLISGITYTVPINAVMTINGGALTDAGAGTGITVGAGAALVVNIPGVPGQALRTTLNDNAVLRLPAANFATFIIESASFASARVYFGDVTLPAIGAGVMELDDVQYFGPSAGKTLSTTVIADPMSIPPVRNWAGTIVASGSVDGTVTNLYALPGATFRLARTDGGSAGNNGRIAMTNVQMPVGTEVRNAQDTITLALSASTIGATFTGQPTTLSAAGSNSVWLNNVTNSLTVGAGDFTILNTAEAYISLTHLSVAANVYVKANTPNGKRVFLLASDTTVTSSNTTLDGVVLVSTADVTLTLPGGADNAVYLRRGGGFAGSRLVVTPSQASTQELQRIVALDNYALINVNVSNANPFDQGANTNGVVQIIGCVATSAASTLPAYVNVTALGLCPAFSDFAGCNNAACNSASNARQNCTVARRTHICGCRVGWAGSECQTNINDCVGIQCANGASCVDGVNTYSCACVPGYSGPLCQTEINECASMPCTEGFRCIDRVNSYECHSLTCPSVGGLTCSGKGYCQSSLGDCSCDVGYTGADCNTPAAALAPGVVELSVTGLVSTDSTAIDLLITHIRTQLGLADGTVTFVSARPGGSNGQTGIVILNLNNDAAQAQALMTLIANNQGVAGTDGITAGRQGDQPVVINAGGESTAQTTPVSDGAAVGLVIAGLIVVIIVVAVIWYFCSNTKDHNTSAAPKTRPTSTSNAGSTAAPAAVELQVR